jgi:TATA-binding protein-associated factor
VHVFFGSLHVVLYEKLEWVFDLCGSGNRVTYLRLDGSVETEKRFDIVKAFNADPTIDVLLLTTHVGGLGLNLTAADTVVFMEHDWNPMRDLQAMDRAHRLGQRRVVNVYRLIMRGTLEEKIMSLQRFKMSIANTIVNAENASLNTMDTAQLLDLFTVSGAPGKVTICDEPALSCGV